MSYEVEMKFPVPDRAALESRLAALGATIAAPQSEVDVYFAHPARDFAKTDEALRIRRKGDCPNFRGHRGEAVVGENGTVPFDAKGSSNFITYKGPKIDAATKTRREIDLPLPPGEQAAQAWTDLIEALGFTPAGEVCKSRRKAQVDWQGRSVEVSLDEVDRLGAYVELELIAKADGLDAARANIISLAEALGLEGSERRSYLELLRAKNGGRSRNLAGDTRQLRAPRNH
jgi:adenylate cyclase class 2